MVYRRNERRVEVVVAEQRDRHEAGRVTLRLPKGKLEPGESFEEAAVREVAEETGLVGRIVGLIDDVHYVYRSRKGQQVDKYVRFYLIEYRSGEPRPLDGEMERVFWCTPAEASRQLTFVTERRVMERAQARLAGDDPC